MIFFANFQIHGKMFKFFSNNIFWQHRLFNESLFFQKSGQNSEICFDHKKVNFLTSFTWDRPKLWNQCNGNFLRKNYWYAWLNFADGTKRLPFFLCFPAFFVEPLKGEIRWTFLKQLLWTFLISVYSSAHDFLHDFWLKVIERKLMLKNIRKSHMKNDTKIGPKIVRFEYDCKPANIPIATLDIYHFLTIFDEIQKNLSIKSVKIRNYVSLHRCFVTQKQTSPFGKSL